MGRTVLLFLLVPAVVVATPGVGQAASNSNPWHTAQLLLDKHFRGDVQCEVSSRYSADGLGVEWTDSTCYNGVDEGLPFADDYIPGEGTHWRLRFEGARAGEVADQAPSWTGSEGCGGVAYSLPGWTVTCTSSAMVIHLPDDDPMVMRGYGSFCGQNVLTGGVHPVQSYVASRHTIEIPTSAGWQTQFPKGQDVGFWAGPIGDCNRADAASSADGVGTYHIAASGEGWTVPPASGGGSDGEGAGNACVGEREGLFAHSDEDSWTHRAGLIEAGSLHFPDEVGGYCLVQRVCLDTSNDDEWGDGDDISGCQPLDYGAPIVPDEAAPEPDTPGKHTPTTPQADDEQSFWDQVLGALQAIFRVIGGALSALADAVGGIATAILDGLQALLVPDLDSLDGSLDGVKDAWADTAPVKFLDGLDQVGDALTFTNPGSSCQGPDLEFDSPVGGQHVDLHPLSSCDPAVAKVASIVKTALTIVVYVGGFLAAARIIGSAIGVDVSMGKGDA